MDFFRFPLPPFPLPSSAAPIFLWRPALFFTPQKNQKIYRSLPEWHRRGAASGQNWADDRAGDVGQAVVAALVLERQPRVVDAQAMQDRGVQVVDVDRVAGDVVAEVVGLAVA